MTFSTLCKQKETQRKREKGTSKGKVRTKEEIKIELKEHTTSIKWNKNIIKRIYIENIKQNKNIVKVANRAKMQASH